MCINTSSIADTFLFHKLQFPDLASFTIQDLANHGHQQQLVTTIIHTTSSDHLYGSKNKVFVVPNCLVVETTRHRVVNMVPFVTHLLLHHSAT